MISKCNPTIRTTAEKIVLQAGEKDYRLVRLKSNTYNLHFRMQVDVRVDVMIAKRNWT